MIDFIEASEFLIHLFFHLAFVNYSSSLFYFFEVVSLEGSYAVRGKEGSCFCGLTFRIRPTTCVTKEGSSDHRSGAPDVPHFAYFS